MAGIREAAIQVAARGVRGRGHRGVLGTTEMGGSTDFDDWVPLEDVPQLPEKADIVVVAFAALVRP